MSFRSKTYLVILAIATQLWHTGNIRASEAPRAPLPSEPGASEPQGEGPAQHVVTLISFDPWVIEGELMGGVAAYVYSDVTTNWPIDYWELYDVEGNLLAISWFDNLGVRKTAVDRGIVEEKDELEGIFVEIFRGDPI
jgi:hypothetical protein